MDKPQNTIIEKVEKSFSLINEKINKLNDSSSDDFMSLANSFKASYSKITELTKNAKIVFEVLDDKKKAFYVELIDKSLGDRSEFFENIQIILKEIHDDSHRDFHQRSAFFIGANNLKQNLNTLKYLIANFSLKENSIGNISENEHLQKVKDSVLEIYDLTKKFEEDINQYNKQILKITKEHKIDFYINFTHLGEFKKHVIKMLEDKYNLILNQSSVLDQKSNSYSESFSKIITNLQYQDIIRQKIEHIYEAHNEALNDISSLDVKDKNYTKEASYTFGQIKEITEIQSAQLIHANKEFQNSINVILEKFKELATTVEDITELGNLFYGNTSTERSFLDDIREEVEVSSSFLFEISNLKYLINEIFQVYTSEIRQIKEFRVVLNSFVSQINEANQILFNHESNSSIDSFIGEIINQIEELDTMLVNYCDNISKLVEGKTVGDSLDDFEENSRQFMKSYNALLKSLKDEDNVLIYKINENKRLSAEIIKEIQNAIDSVKFYNQFEITVDSIVDELDVVRNLLMKEGFVSNDGKMIIKLKELYTMQTERDVHESITGKKDVQLNNVSQNDENLELF